MFTEGVIACLEWIALKNEEFCYVFPALEYISFAACNIQSPSATVHEAVSPGIYCAQLVVMLQQP